MHDLLKLERADAHAHIHQHPSRRESAQPDVVVAGHGRTARGFCGALLRALPDMTIPGQANKAASP